MSNMIAIRVLENQMAARLKAALVVRGPVCKVDISWDGFANTFPTYIMEANSFRVLLHYLEITQQWALGDVYGA